MQIQPTPKKEVGFYLSVLDNLIERNKKNKTKKTKRKRE